MANTFAYQLPKVSLPRTKAKMPFSHKTSFNHGDLVPVDILPVMPGSTIKARVASVIRMSEPFAPIMDNIYGQFHAFFVPMRLIYAPTKRFFGENEEGAGPVDPNLELPSINLNGTVDTCLDEKSLGFYLGKPIFQDSQAQGTLLTGDYLNNAVVKVSPFKERVYALIWNEWYRAQQLQAPVFIDIESYSATAGDQDLMTGPLFKVNKKSDYFTRSTISPQYASNAVSIPLGDYVPVISKQTEAHELFPFSESNKRIFGSSINSAGVNGYTSSGSYVDYALGVSKQANTVALPFSDTALGNINSTSLVADLTNMTHSISNLRLAFALDLYLRRDNFGSRYFEYLQVHFGTTNPDLVLYRPELLGESLFRINVNQVLQTAGYSDTASENTLGTPGANSTTGHKCNLFTKSCGEWGFIAIMFATKHDRTYGQGIMREDTKLTRFEYYSPEFARLGDQLTKNYEIFYSTRLSDYDPQEGVPTVDTSLNHKGFGFNEHWMEHKTRFDRCSGLLAPWVANSLAYWNLAENFAGHPTLSDSFIKENRDSITRALKSGTMGPDYIADFFIDYEVVQPMPYSSIPGLSFGLGL